MYVYCEYLYIFGNTQLTGKVPLNKIFTIFKSREAKYPEHFKFLNKIALNPCWTHAGIKVLNGTKYNVISEV